MSTALKLATERRPGDTLSPSSHNQFRRCAAAWAYRHVEHCAEPPSGAMAQGTAFHAAIEENFRQRLESHEDLSVAAVTALYRDAWGLLLKGDFPDPFERPKQPPEFADDEDPEQLRKEGEALTVKFLEERCPAIEPAAVELPVRGFIGGVEVSGFIDLIEVDGRIHDYKIVKRSPSEDKVAPDYAFQIATYVQICPQASGAATVDHVVKNKQIKIATQDYAVQPYDLEETRRMYPAVQQAIRTGLFLPNRGNFLCSRRGCPHWRRCEADWGGKVAA